jgi:thiol-disulfide isomerase/thioredoxin
MRKLLFSFLLVSLSMGSALAQAPSVISGTWNKRTPRTVKLFKVENGALKEVASTTLSDDNKFFFAFSPEKAGFHVVGLNAGKQHGYPFYFKPGDQLNVVMNEDNTYTLVGENTPENKEMARWHDFIFPLEDKAVYFAGKNSTYVDFFPLLSEKLKGAAAWKQNYNANEAFNEAFKNFRTFDMEFDAFHFLCTPRSSHPKPADLPDYYRHVTLPEMTATENLLDYPYGMDLISRYVMAQGAFLPESREKMLGGEKSFMPVMMLPHIANEKIRGEQTLALAQGLKSYEALVEYEGKYGQYLVTPAQKERFKALIAQVAENNPGQQAIDFKFADKDGKEIALSDLKGKVVYIDVWATWCGPCRKEFPFMKELEAEYHGNNNIVFMGVSVDETRDKQKWLDFLTAEQLPGLQVFAGDAANNAIMKPYKIGSIPRFILVGKDGNLIFADAPRPSSDEIRAVLNSALSK